MPTWLADNPKNTLQTKADEIKGREKKKLEMTAKGKSWKNKKEKEEGEAGI